jgi:hypothetical protein
MSETNSVGHTDSLEILAQWEGPALHEPGVLFEEKEAEHLSAGTEVAELAAWIAVTVLSGGTDESAHEARKAKVLGVLCAWRQRFGQARIDEVKQQLFQQMQNYRNQRKISDEELRERIEKFFDEIRV